MATLDLDKILGTPVFVLEWLSNNLDLDQVLIQPSLFSYANDWNTSVVISQPQVDASVSSGEVLDINITLQQPIFRLQMIQGRLLQASLFPISPDTEILVSSQMMYTLSKTISNITFTGSLYESNSQAVSILIQKPTIIGDWYNKKTNASDYGVTTTADLSNTFILNTLTNAVSTYSNYSFNSYFKLNNRYFGINSTGVHELVGETDGSSQINTIVHTPISSFNKQGLKACSDAIVFGRIIGDMEIVTVNDEQEEREGFIVRDDGRNGLHRIRAKIPMGLKGSTWQFKLKNVDGSQFSINNLEVFIRELQRIR